MSGDMEFDYKKIMKKLDCKDSDVNELRGKIEKFEHIPKGLSSRKV